MTGHIKVWQEIFCLKNPPAVPTEKDLSQELTFELTLSCKKRKHRLY